MMKITIKNGLGSTNINPGFYNVKSEIPGYENSTIDPKLIKISNQNNYEFKISAAGTLTLHVIEDNCKKPIKDAIFVRTDALGNTYGNPIKSNKFGDAVFKNVPYGKDAPYIYFKQLGNDNLDFNDKVHCVKLKKKTETFIIKNRLNSLKTFKLVDKDYGLPLSGNLVLK